MFATRPLEAGDLIFAERAMIIASGAVYSVQSADHLTGKEYLRAILMDAEKKLEIAYGRLLRERKEAFMALTNSHENDGSGPLMGRLRTNGFIIRGLSDAGGRSLTVKRRIIQILTSMPDVPYSGVFDVLSRINHRLVI